MFSTRLFGAKKERRSLRRVRVDLVNEQVKKMLTATDQKLILMVRG